MKYIGYSRVELLQLFQFAIEIEILPYRFDLNIKAEYFVQEINDAPGLHSLRMQVSKQKSRHSFQALHKDGLSFKKGEVLKVVKNEDDEWWYMQSFHTDNIGDVPISYIIPIEGKYSEMYYKHVYYHIMDHNVAKERLSRQADTQKGSFLINKSERKPGVPRQHTLILNNGVITTYHRIHFSLNKCSIGKSVWFDSLNDLVHHYMMKADGLPCSIKIPIPKQRNMPIAVNKEFEINKSHIKFSKCINAGQFGETWKGVWKGEGPVMIKTNIATNITQETFIDAANILAKLHHKNIISLYGVCTENYPLYIVTELMINGNLKDYLTTNNLTPAELVDIAIQVTEGMIYLGEQDYIHCNLKAASILLGYNNTVKIANFHLAQHLNGNKYWTVEEGTELAIRWTAPEGYTLNQLSIKSDVWSFGILLWELATKGHMPYPGMTHKE
uniref:Tyrosine-protein kinase n=1 Tax=Amphimedon queenslandica TaxID=400682 RepID=A0A1X7SNZ2_AMPQE